MTEPVSTAGATYRAAAADQQERMGVEHRETILLLIQALNSRIAALDREPAPPGWWFTPPVYFSDR